MSGEQHAVIREISPSELCEKQNSILGISEQC